MKTYLECIPCFFKQALHAAKLAGSSPKTQKEILMRLSKEIPKFSLNCSPPEMGRTIYSLVNKYSPKKDPYAAEKKKSNELSLAIYPKLKKLVKSSEKPLLKAVELAIAGNIIDFGVKANLNIKRELLSIIKKHEAADKQQNKFFQFKAFEKKLKECKNILYLGDNAGETVFDRILIEEILAKHKGKKIIYAVKDKPVLNDALFEDAEESGLCDLAEIVSSGSDAPGTVLKFCSKEFMKIYRSADMVISKGQGNYEALSNANREIFFLFIAKCPVVCKGETFSLKDMILKYHRRNDDTQYKR